MRLCLKQNLWNGKRGRDRRAAEILRDLNIEAIARVAFIFNLNERAFERRAREDREHVLDALDSSGRMLLVIEQHGRAKLARGHAALV